MRCAICQIVNSTSIVQKIEIHVDGASQVIEKKEVRLTRAGPVTMALKAGQPIDLLRNLHGWDDGNLVKWLSKLGHICALFGVANMLAT